MSIFLDKLKNMLFSISIYKSLSFWFIVWVINIKNVSISSST